MAESLQHPRRPPKPHAPILFCFKAFACVLPFAQLVIGAMYQFDCPAQRYIPIYLLGSGVTTLLLVVLNICPCTAGFGDHSKIWSCFYSTFFFCWFIAGNVWIYSIYEPNYNKTSTATTIYCNKTLYLFAFWTTNVNYIFLGLLLLSSCCQCFLCGDD